MFRPQQLLSNGQRNDKLTRVGKEAGAYERADFGVDVGGLDGGVEVLGGEGDALHGRGAAPLGGLVEQLAHPLPLPLVLGQRVRPAHQRGRRAPRRRGAVQRRAGEGRAREAGDGVLRQGRHPLRLPLVE
jgi:hypothetical protein